MCAGPAKALKAFLARQLPDLLRRFNEVQSKWECVSAAVTERAAGQRPEQQAEDGHAHAKADCIRGQFWGY